MNIRISWRLNQIDYPTCLDYFVVDYYDITYNESTYSRSQFFRFAFFPTERWADRLDQPYKWTLAVTQFPATRNLGEMIYIIFLVPL